MPRWSPEQIWKDQDVFIIGGGKSLETFDWNLLKREYTIGCNDAYTLGQSVCNICVFGDSKWFNVHQRALSKFEGAVFTNAPRFYKTTIPWLWVMLRKNLGFGHDTLGWNNNTGATAINLALILGAKRVYLLGFDMHPTKGQTNWHSNSVDRRQEGVYSKFLTAFNRLPGDLEREFPGRVIINVTDNSSLNVFSKIGVEKFFEERQAA